MQSTVYFVLLAAVLTVNAGLSFYHAGIANQDYQNLASIMEFKAKGARYTYDDGVRDRADRDRVDAALNARIESLEAVTQCQHH